MFTPFDPKKTTTQVEEEVLKLWKEKDIFNKSVKQREAAESFVFFEGPPTANGKPGIHHVMARTFKDTICRYQTMKGKQVLRKAGWDTHGLPVELQVEKALGLKNKQDIEAYGVAAFNQKCKESVWQYKEEFETVTDRMGYWIDMENPYVTYSKKYIESVWWGLKQVWDKGHVYQAHKVVPYCTRCGTALSLAEVAQGYKSVTETSVYIKFALQDAPIVETSKPVAILAWTTTPWTLPGNVALAVGESIEYVAVELEDDVVIVAKELIEKLQSTGVLPADSTVVATFVGADLVGLSYEPLFPGAVTANDAAFKVYAADFVTTEDGTGIVHTAVMYGEDDYVLGTKLGLPKQHTVLENGTFTDSVGSELAGRYVKDPETEKIILEQLDSRSLLQKKLAYKHDYPFCWRCDTALLYYARDSWFIRIDDNLRDRLVELNQEINWVPEHVKNGRFGNWLEGLRDWAISRERYWGTPAPFWICDADQSHRVCVGSVAELESLATAGSKATITNHEFDLHKPFIDDITLTCPECAETMHRVPEVLDVWVDSGSMPFAQWHYPTEGDNSFKRQFPADFITEGIDQTRGWFNSLHILSTIIFDSVAYKSVITQNLVNDEHGKKMSKSKGNIVDPLQVMNETGADALRFYFLTVNQPGENKNFAIRTVQEVYRKNIALWWNVVSFFLTYASVDQWQSGQDGERTTLDRWIVASANKTANYIDQSLEGLDIFAASRSFTEYLDGLSTWYLRRSRKRRDAAFYATLHEVLVKTSMMAAPLLPFIAEATYLALKTEEMPESVHLADFPSANTVDETALTDMAAVREIVTQGHAFRAEHGIKLRQPLAQAIVSHQSGELSAELSEIVRDELNVKRVVVTTADQLQVTMDTVLTPELKEEGQVRELVRAIQDFRKKSGCKAGQRVEIGYVVDGELSAVIDRNRATLEEETLSQFKEGAGETMQEVQIDDQTLRLGLLHAE